MRLGESNRPFDTLFHRRKLHRKNRVFDGIEGFDHHPEIADMQLILLPQK
jgi:hypothetical protein